MNEPEHRNEKQEHSAAPYVTTALGFGLLIAAVLVINTADVYAAGFPFVIAAAALLGVGISGFVKQRHALPSPVNKERELLSAIRDGGGSITPAEAAMETSLTVREADALLSELAGSGHLLVEREGGTLFYSLPGKRTPELGSSTSG